MLQILSLLPPRGTGCSVVGRKAKQDVKFREVLLCFTNSPYLMGQAAPGLQGEAFFRRSRSEFLVACWRRHLGHPPAKPTSGSCPAQMETPRSRSAVALKKPLN